MPQIINTQKLENLQRATKQNKADLEPFLDIFFTETPQIFTQAELFLKKKENTKAHLKIHYIKGSADAIGADQLSSLCNDWIGLFMGDETASQEELKQSMDFISKSINETIDCFKDWLTSE